MKEENTWPHAEHVFDSRQM